MKLNFEPDKIGNMIDVPDNLPPMDIIVISHNNLVLTASCIQAVYDQTTAPFHLIVSDDSTDLTPTYLYRLREQHENITVAHSLIPLKEGNDNINNGLVHTKHDYVAILTNSMTVCWHWEVHALQLLQRKADIGIVGMKTLTPGGVIEDAGMLVLPEGDPVDLGHGLAAQLMTNIYEVPVTPWCFVILRRKAIVEPLPLGIYYPFRGWDDIDNCFLLRQAGWKIYYCGYGAGYHLACATRGSEQLEARRQSVENGRRFRKRWGYHR